MVDAFPDARGVVAIGDLTIHDVSFDETVKWVVDAAQARAGGYVCTPNVDYVVRARRDFPFRAAIAGARLRVPDGMWIVYASRIAGRPLHGTVTGRKLVPAIARIAADRGLTVALVGAGPGVADDAAAALGRQSPKLKVVVTASPPNPLEIGAPSDHALVGLVSRARPDVIFVALGAPRQELWMQAHANEFDGAVLVGVGAAFDIIAGRFREAPSWMTAAGLEWMFRLAQEPRRLARRYLVDDPWILWWAVRTRISHAAHGRGRDARL